MFIQVSVNIFEIIRSEIFQNEKYNTHVSSFFVFFFLSFLQPNIFLGAFELDSVLIFSFNKLALLPYDIHVEKLFPQLHVTLKKLSQRKSGLVPFVCFMVVQEIACM